MSQETLQEIQELREAEPPLHPRAELIGRDNALLASGTVSFTQAAAHRERRALAYFQPDNSDDLEMLRGNAKILRFRDLDIEIVGTRDGGLACPEQIQLYLDLEG